MEGASTSVAQFELPDQTVLGKRFGNRSNLELPSRNFQVGTSKLELPCWNSKVERVSSRNFEHLGISPNITEHLRIILRGGNSRHQLNNVLSEPQHRRLNRYKLHLRWNMHIIKIYCLTGRMEREEFAVGTRWAPFKKHQSVGISIICVNA